MRPRLYGETLRMSQAHRRHTDIVHPRPNLYRGEFDSIHEPAILVVGPTHRFPPGSAVTPLPSHIPERLFGSLLWIRLTPPIPQP